MEDVPLPSPLQGARILIVEDESILAMEIEDQLRREGCEVIGPISRETKAIATLERDQPDAVVLDLNLNGKLATDLADALVARRTPFVVVTGYGKGQFNIPALQNAPRMHKPIKTQDLVRTLADLVRSTDRLQR
jgi:DNA-binding response OmpR family regulator